MRIQNGPVQRLGIQPVKPDARMVAESIAIPWIFHSDGNLDAVLDEWTLASPGYTRSSREPWTSAFERE